MRIIYTIGGLALLTLVASAPAPLAQAQEAASVVIETGPNCLPNNPVYCPKILVNRNTGGRVVVNLERHMVSNSPATFYDRSLSPIGDVDSSPREVLLSAGARAPLLTAIILAMQPSGNAGLFVEYRYTILGSHPPGPDDIADDQQQNVDDYFRLVSSHHPMFDHGDACRIGSVAHPARLLAVVNFNATKSIVITHRNSAPRYGSNATVWRTQTIPPGSTGGGVGCETDIAAGFIEIREIRFGT
jgi:hypothetical protein